MVINTRALTAKDIYIKRSFDVSLSFIGLVLILPVIVISWIMASIEFRSNGFFTQLRVGKNGHLFRIFKIKTMKKNKGIYNNITMTNDVRITRIGAFFRRTKIDELPQLWNVFVGQMSLVGPRPDVPGYLDKLQGGDRVVLSVRPGITGPAQLAYRDEEKILFNQVDAIKYNDKVIWPDKVRINRKYIENYTLFKDFYYIWKTIVGGDVKY
jgi:lipopolysaccharide/colanic/teichoic acid biosynthesis glycosyltransferase